MALLSINGMGAPTARATLSINAWAQSRRALLISINAWAHSPRAANHPKIVTIRALCDPMPLKGMSPYIRDYFWNFHPVM